MASHPVYDNFRRPWSRVAKAAFGCVVLMVVILVFYYAFDIDTERYLTMPNIISVSINHDTSSSQSPSSSPLQLHPSTSTPEIWSDHEDTGFPGTWFTGNVALIMETDPTKIANFVPLVQHFRSTLSPTWEMVLLTRRGWAIPDSPSFRRLLDTRALKVRFLPPEWESFPDHSSVSVFLASPWLWKEFEGVNRLLMFQPDSILCTASAHTVDDFLEWDYIGAPVRPDLFHCPDEHGEHAPGMKRFNGGLSIRNPRLFLDVAQRYKFSADLHSKPEGEGLPACMMYEDHWFMWKVENTPELAAEARLPPAEVAGGFSVESWFWERPLGYHQPYRWQKERYGEIVEWCPEVSLIYGQEMPDHRWDPDAEVEDE